MKVLYREGLAGARTPASTCSRVGGVRSGLEAARFAAARAARRPRVLPKTKSRIPTGRTNSVEEGSTTDAKTVPWPVAREWSYPTVFASSPLRTEYNDQGCDPPRNDGCAEVVSQPMPKAGVLLREGGV